ncbi:hypothetical protein OKW24_002708 [Peribacillus simplex]|nr:hypothetical protein [Peribacillus simplex]
MKKKDLWTIQRQLIQIFFVYRKHNYNRPMTLELEYHHVNYIPHYYIRLIINKANGFLHHLLPYLIFRVLILPLY